MQLCSVVYLHTYLHNLCYSLLDRVYQSRRNSAFKRRFGYLPLDDLLDAGDESLFTSTRYNPQHVLHQLLPPPKQISYNLRSRGHGLTLSSIPSEFMRKNFLYRMLYNDIYINVKTCVIFLLTLLFTLCACLVDYAFVIVVIKESYYY